MNRTSPDPRANDPAQQMSQYDVVRVAADRFAFGGYSYPRLEDAVAEAKRRPRAAGDCW